METLTREDAIKVGFSLATGLNESTVSNDKITTDIHDKAINVYSEGKPVGKVTPVTNGNDELTSVLFLNADSKDYQELKVNSEYKQLSM